MNFKQYDRKARKDMKRMMKAQRQVSKRKIFTDIRKEVGYDDEQRDRNDGDGTDIYHPESSSASQE